MWESVMKVAIGSYDAKTKLPELLRQVKTGRSFTITNRGKAIVDLVRSLGARARDKVAAATRPKAFMLADPVHGVNIKELTEDSCQRPAYGSRFRIEEAEQVSPSPRDGPGPGTSGLPPARE